MGLVGWLADTGEPDGGWIWLEDCAGTEGCTRFGGCTKLRGSVGDEIELEGIWEDASADVLLLRLRADEWRGAGGERDAGGCCEGTRKPDLLSSSRYES